MIWTNQEPRLYRCFRSIVHQHAGDTRQVISITCMLMSSEEGNSLEQCVSAYLNPPQTDILPRLLRYRLIFPADILAFSLRRTYWIQGMLYRDNRSIQIPVTLLGVADYPATAQLRAIACHSGGSQSGHYICYANIHGVWYMIDDASHQCVSAETVCISSACTWVITFYEK